MNIKGYGQNGCVVYPSWNEDKNQVTKIFVTADSLKSFQRETSPTLLTRLSRIDPGRSQYSYAISFSNTILGSEVQLKDISDCARYFQGQTVVPFRDVAQIQQPFLQEAPKDRSLTTSEIDFLQNSLEELHRNGVVHNDVHIHNVMQNPSTKTLVWSDFGESLTQDEIDKETFEELVAKDNENFRLKVKNWYVNQKPTKKRTRNFDSDESDPKRSNLFGSMAEPAAVRLFSLVKEAFQESKSEK